MLFFRNPRFLRMTAIVCREYNVGNNCYMSTTDRALWSSALPNLFELENDVIKLSETCKAG